MLFLSLVFFVTTSSFGAMECDYIVGYAKRGKGRAARQVEHLRNYLSANSDLVLFTETGDLKGGSRTFCIRAKNHGDLLAVRGHLERIVAQSPASVDSPRGIVIDCRTPKVKKKNPACVALGKSK